jgi:hypothetical protein
VNTITQNNNSAYSWAKSLYSNNGSMHLLETTSASLPSAKYSVELAPVCPRIEVPNTANVSEYNPINLLGIYPNPASDKINVHFQSIEEGLHHIEIRDLNGKVVLSNDKFTSGASSSIAILDLSQLQAGTYLIYIESTSGRIETARFIKE